MWKVRRSRSTVTTDCYSISNNTAPTNEMVTDIRHKERNVISIGHSRYIVHGIICSPTNRPMLKITHKYSAHFSCWHDIARWGPEYRFQWHRRPRLLKTLRAQCKSRVVDRTVCKHCRYRRIPLSQGSCLYSGRHSLLPSSSSVMSAGIASLL